MPLLQSAGLGVPAGLRMLRGYDMHRQRVFSQMSPRMIVLLAVALAGCGGDSGGTGGSGPAAMACPMSDSQIVISCSANGTCTDYAGSTWGGDITQALDACTARGGKMARTPCTIACDKGKCET